jgi:hypothetical protein
MRKGMVLTGIYFERRLLKNKGCTCYSGFRAARKPASSSPRSREDTPAPILRPDLSAAARPVAKAHRLLAQTHAPPHTLIVIVTTVASHRHRHHHHYHHVRRSWLQHLARILARRLGE